MGNISPIRDIIEIELCKTALKKNIPILGICRGCQVLAIASGGNIYQDIYSQYKTNIKHSQQAPKYYPTHNITIESNSKIFNIYNMKRISVNSFHHQSISIVSKEFIISAKSDDNIIEAIEHKYNKFCIGVQWHPETMFERYSNQLELFKAFILSCKE